MHALNAFLFYSIGSLFYKSDANIVNPCKYYKFHVNKVRQITSSSVTAISTST